MTETATAHRLEAAALADEIEFLAARTRAVGTSIANRRLAPLGLQVRSYSVLALASADLAPTQRELADFLRLDPSQIVAIVDELENARLVRRQPDPTDRRSKIIVATPQGKLVHAEAVAATRASEAEALAALTADEASQLRTLLRKVAFAEAPPAG
ncbi:MAG: MarR family transcriptional regulator [Pseudolysinimonas sp.]